MNVKKPQAVVITCLLFSISVQPPCITQGPHVLAHKTRFAGDDKNTINTFLFSFNGNPLTPLKRNYTSYIFQIIKDTKHHMET